MLFAVQVYSPLCLYPTDAIVSMLVLVPNVAVESPGSEDTSSPLSDHLMVNGSSPLLTTQTSWANSPSSRISFPKDNGFREGISEEK